MAVLKETGSTIENTDVEYREGLGKGMKVMESKTEGDENGCGVTADTRLMNLIERIKGDLHEAVSIIEEEKKVGKAHEVVYQDLGHILELEELTDNERLKLSGHMKDRREKRRVSKNVNSVGVIVGNSFREWEKSMQERMGAMMAVLRTDNKYYRIKGKDTVKIFEDITGRTIESTEGRYFDASDYVDEQTGHHKIRSNVRKHDRLVKSKEAESTGQAKGTGESPKLIYGKDIEPVNDTGEKEPLSRKKFEEELNKVVNKRKPRNKKNKRKTKR